MSNHERLADRWHSRDFPVLLEVARRLDGGARTVMARDVARDLDMERLDVIGALDGLVPNYLTGKPLDSFGGRVDFGINGITERGRRTVGLWPSEEGVEALMEALRQAEEATSDPEEKTLIRRAAGAVGSVSRDIMVDVVAAVVARQSGVG